MAKNINMESSCLLVAEMLPSIEARHVVLKLEVNVKHMTIDVKHLTVNLIVKAKGVTFD